MRLPFDWRLLWLLPALLMLVWLERQWPVIAWVCMIVLTLSVGFAHGAMDIFLLRNTQGRLSLGDCLIYAAAVVCLAVLLMAWPSVALIVLILLSMWHFGEQAYHEHSPKPEAWLLRGVQGGSSVMLPVLLSPDALLLWVKSIAGTDASWVWPIWVGMAGLWAALLMVACVLIKPWRADAIKTLWIELLVLILLNLVLSPLLAFALFFGVYHSGMHIWRMRQMQRREGKIWKDGHLVLTLTVTLLALAVLAWWMSNQAFALSDAGQWLRVLVVALAAVTLPHLVLVTRRRQRLFASP